MKLKELIEQYGEYEVKNGFMELLEEPKPKTIYNLKEDDLYWFIGSAGEIRYAVYINDFFDEKRQEIGNMFLKKKEAKFAVERLKVIVELKKYAKEFSDEEWQDWDLPKYDIKSDCRNHVIRIVYARYLKGNDIYFESEEKAKEAIEAVGEDRVKKYYLGVKE